MTAISLPLPDTHKQALRWLLDHGGEGVIDQYGRVVAQGERYKSIETAQVWLRLFCSGHLESAGPLRLKLAEPGKVVALTVMPDAEPTNFASDRGKRRPMMMDDDAEDFA